MTARFAFENDGEKLKCTLHEYSKEITKFSLPFLFSKCPIITLINKAKEELSFCQ